MHSKWLVRHAIAPAIFFVSGITLKSEVGCCSCCWLSNFIIVESKRPINHTKMISLTTGVQKSPSQRQVAGADSVQLFPAGPVRCMGGRVHAQDAQPAARRVLAGVRATCLNEMRINDVIIITPVAGSQ